MVDQSVIIKEIMQILHQTRDIIKTDKMQQQIHDTIMPIIEIVFSGIYNQYHYVIYMFIVILMGMVFSMIFIITLGLYSIHKFMGDIKRQTNIPMWFNAATS